MATNRMDEKKLWTDPWRRRHRPLIFDTVDFALRNITRPITTILDLGGGDGCLVGELLSRLDEGQAIIVDTNRHPDLVAVLSSYQVLERVEFCHDSVSNLDVFLPGATFDLVVCRSALHHFRHPNKVLDSVHRLISKGVYFLLCDAFFPEHSATTWSAINHIREGDFVSYYTYHGIFNMLAEAGLQARLIRPYTFVHEDLEAYLWPAAEGCRASLKRAILALDERTKREMGFAEQDEGVRFHYTCFDLLATPARNHYLCGQAMEGTT